MVVINKPNQMYNLGFIKDISWLFRRMSPVTQYLNLLFPTTLSYFVQELAFKQMNQPKYIEVKPKQKNRSSY